MAHVFVSYSKKRRALTERVVALLERQEVVAPDGSRKRLTVWWDKSLKAGDVFHREITQAIDDARAVVVIGARARSPPTGSAPRLSAARPDASSCRCATRCSPTSAFRSPTAPSTSTTPTTTSRWSRASWRGSAAARARTRAPSAPSSAGSSTRRPSRRSPAPRASVRRCCCKRSTASCPSSTSTTAGPI